MFEYYFDESTGKQYKVHVHNLDKFKLDFKNAYKIKPFGEAAPLPTLKKEDIKVTEEVALSKLTSQFSGMGYDFEESNQFTESSLSSVFAPAADYIKAIAPPDENGYRREEIFSFDKGILGSDIGLSTIFGSGVEEEADRFNKFIQETYINGEIEKDIDADIYAQTIKFAKSKPITFTNDDGSVKTMQELTSNELEERQQMVFNEMFDNEKIWEKVTLEIGNPLKEYVAEQVALLKPQYDLTDKEEVEELNARLNTLIRAKQEELINESYEYKRLTKSVEAGVTSIYGSRQKNNSAINKKAKLEAEGEYLPVASALRDIPLIGDAWADLSHGVGVGRIQIAKGDNEYRNIISKEFSIRSKKSELAQLKKQVKEANETPAVDGISFNPLEVKYTKMSKPSIKDNVSTVEFSGTVGERIKNLENGLAADIRSLQEGISKSKLYQKKISALDPAKIFGDNILDVNVTVDEWQKMMGTQGTQMLASMFIYPTFAQEAGGIASESMTIEAARIEFPELYVDVQNPTTEEDQRAQEAFYLLSEKDPEKAIRIMTNVVTNGEVDFGPAIRYGAGAASLDLLGTVFVFAKAFKFIPMSVVKEGFKNGFVKVLASKTGKKLLVQGTKAVGGATGVEAITEALQEKLGFEGVEASTGYAGDPEQNVMRMMEGAGQAILTTPFFVGGGAATRTGMREFKAKFYANPKQSRFLINQEKTLLKKALDNGNLDYETYIETINELDAVENAFNNVDKFTRMDNEAKEKVISSLVEKTKLETQKQEILNEQKKFNEENPGMPSYYQKDNNNKIKELDDQIAQQQNNIFKELLKDNYFREVTLVDWINQNQNGEFKGKKFKRFKTREQAKDYFAKVFNNKDWYNVATSLQNKIEELINGGFNIKEANNKAFDQFSEIAGTERLLQYLDMKTLHDGNVNAAVDGSIAWIIDDNIVTNIMEKGDPTATNAIHHEGMHFTQSNMGMAELQDMVLEIETQLKNTKDERLQKVWAMAQTLFNARYAGKVKKSSKAYYKEWMTNLSDAMKYYDVIDITQDGSETMFNIGKIFGNMFKKEMRMPAFDWSKMDAKTALTYIQRWNNFRGVASDRSVSIRLPKGKVNTDQEDKKETEGGVLASEVYTEINNTMMEYIDIDREVAANMTADMMQGIVFDRLIKLKNAGLIEGFTNKDLEDIQLQFTGPRKDIANSLKNRGAVGLLMKFEKDFKGGVMGYFNATKRGRKMLDMRLQEFVENHPRYGNIQVSIQQEGVTKAIDAQETTKTPEDVMIDKETDLEKSLTPTTSSKINVLKIGKNRTSDKIIDAVRVKDGDTFKEVQENNVEAVTKIVFDIPANKITNPQANLTYAKKIVDGIPESSEAGNIQNYYAFEPAMTSEIRVLPKSNVTTEDAFVNKIDKIKVSKKTKGRAIGLKNNVLNYFYDKKFKADGKRARSKGETSQVGLWQLKDEFINPTPETVKKVQREFFGITPAKELNLYDRNIGQNLKGFANFTVTNKSLSAAQRILDARKADPQQVADVTSAQSSTAFSELAQNLINELFTEGSLDPNFNPDLAGINKLNTLLELNGIEKTLNLKNLVLTEDGRKEMLESFKQIMTLLPKKAWFGQNGVGASVFTRSNSDYGVSMAVTVGKRKNENNEYVDPVNAGHFNAFKKMLTDLRDDESYTNYGQDILGVTDYTVSSYKKLLKNKQVKEFNATVSLIHDALWTRIHKFVGKDKNNAAVVGNYLKLVANDTGHWHKLGAQIVGYSLNAKKVEFEHAMPATAAYLYLLDASINRKNFARSYELVIDNYKLIALDKVDDIKLRDAKLARNMPIGWKLGQNFWWQRYFNDLVDIDPNSIVDFNGVTFAKKFKIKNPIRKNTKSAKVLAKSVSKSRLNSEVVRGITVLDFDDTLATSKSLIKYTQPDGTKGTLTPEQYASTYQDLQDLGYKFDFSEFNKVVDGKIAPLFQKALKLQGKFGPENMFVLTARPAESAPAIFAFIKANGLNIPLKNITGLANSTAEAKALWIADKVAEGFNDFYFADDALQNVQAVKNMLDQFDVKSKVQQARVLFSETMSDGFNKILEDVTGIDAAKRFSAVKARKRGAGKGKFRLFIPPSHEDFVGLLYNFMGKGKEGNAHRDFLEKSLVKPLNRAFRELNAAEQSIANDYAALNKQYKDVKNKLAKKTPDGDFKYEDAIRVYLWDKHGYEVEGLSETDKKQLVDLVKSDPELQAYADQLNIISKQDKYVEPLASWEAGDIRTDLTDATGRIGRSQFFEEFFQNADIIFSQENLNKIEAAFGENMVDAIKDMLYRVKTGRNRPAGQNKMVNTFMNWLNGSVAATMFFNIRSSVLQQMSMVNFINFADNNVFAAAKAFANQKQFWTDWSMLFNSDFMKQRRGGIMTDVNGAELAASVKNATNPVQALIKKLLQLGFLPTQIGDNIAIATGGSTFYRNRVNKYIKDGLSKKEAEEKAFIDFQIIAEATQQSARPDMVSQQQASPLGKVILAFQNVTSQFNRLGKKAFLDIKNRRITPGNETQFQSDISNASRIAYYLAIQNLIFYSLQTALFAAIFDDDDEDEKLIKKKEYMINGSIDSVLRGAGVMGSVIATLKNMARTRAKQQNKEMKADPYAVLADALNVSPPLGIKARKMIQAEKDLIWNRDEIQDMELFDIENPLWSAYTSHIEGISNVPLNRLYRKTINVRDALDSQHSAFQRVLMFSGWSKWNLNIPDKKIVKPVIPKKRKYVAPY